MLVQEVSCSESEAMRQGLLRFDKAGISVNDKPKFYASVAIDYNQNTDYWYKLAFCTEYDKLSVEQICKLCAEIKLKGAYCGIIYCYTNQINGKRYIGQTINPRERNTKHKHDMYTKRYKHLPIYRAISKYGFEHFDYRVLGIVVQHTIQDRIKLLNIQEKYFIKLYHSADKRYGYNICDGGTGLQEHHPTAIRINQYDKAGNYIASYHSILEAEQTLDVKGISQSILDKRYYAGGYIFAPQNIDISAVVEYHQNLKVSQYKLTGEFVQEFDSIKDASIAVKGMMQPIIHCCKTGTHLQAYGFRWSHTKIDNLGTAIKDRQVKSIYQYDKHGLFVAKYTSMQDAAQKLGLSDPKSIRRAINSKKLGICMSFWRTEYMKMLDSKEVEQGMVKTLRSIKVIYDSGKEECYNTIREAQNALGLSTYNIIHCIEHQTYSRKLKAKFEYNE